MLPSDLSVRTFSYFSEWKNNNNDILTDFQLEALYFVFFLFRTSGFGNDLWYRRHETAE